MLWICKKWLTCIWKEKLLQQCIFYCKFLIFNEPAKLLFWQSADLDEIYRVTSANIAPTINSNQFNWLSPYWLGKLFESGRKATKCFNCFNHRQGTGTEIMVLDSNMLTSQDHMERGKRSVHVVCVPCCTTTSCWSCWIQNPSKVQQHLLEQAENFDEKMVWQHAAEREESRAAFGGRGFNKKYWSWVCFPKLRKNECLAETVSLAGLSWHQSVFCLPAISE